MRRGDTIVAISTPPGRGGLGVVRLSGAAAREIAEAMLRFIPGSSWRGWRARSAALLDEDGAALDRVVVTFFEKPRSYTAEDVVEIACHGSPVILRRAVERAVRLGARVAEPGEFTLRAFVNGRLDLPQAEAIRDLIDSTTLYQARVAMQQAEGSLSVRLRPAKEQLLELIALLEAGIDFAEDDISVAPPEEILRRIEPIAAAVDALVRSFAWGKLVHDGFTLAIVGRPNVGKSSLFNRLLEQDRAIVTDIPGTTRDLVSETASLGGLPVRFVDTAGIRQGQDPVERLGIERSYQAMADADLIVVVLDASAPSSAEEEDRALVEKARSSGRPAVVVWNKVDLREVASEDGGNTLPVSALTGQGIEALRERILSALAPEGGMADPHTGFLTSVRHEALLRESREALENAVRAVETGIPHEMLLLDLYAALQPIDAVTGATTADDILNRIFTTFCIGK